MALYSQSMRPILVKTLKKEQINSSTNQLAQSVQSVNGVSTHQSQKRLSSDDGQRLLDAESLDANAGDTTSDNQKKQKKKRVSFAKDESVCCGVAEDIDRRSNAQPPRCDGCKVHLVGFKYECKQCDYIGSARASNDDAEVNERERNTLNTIEQLNNENKNKNSNNKNTMLEIEPASPHESRNKAFSPTSDEYNTTTADNSNTNNVNNKRHSFKLCVSCYTMHARLSMSRMRYIEMKDDIGEEETLLATMQCLPVVDDDDDGTNSLLWLQLASQLQIHEHDPKNFIRTGLDDQMILEEIIRDRATLMVNGDDRLSKMLKEATRRREENEAPTTTALASAI